MKATIKFQLENGFGVAVIQNQQNTELTFVSKEKYKSGEEVFASPYYRKGKLVCDVFRVGENYIARLKADHLATHAHVVVNIGTHRPVNGYAVYEKTLTLEWKDCKVVSVSTKTTPNKNYREGYREFIATIIHNPTKFEFNVVIFDETDINNNHSIRERSSVEYTIKGLKELAESLKRKHQRELAAPKVYENLLGIYENLLESFSEDEWENMKIYHQGKMKVHALDYSPNYKQEDVFKKHLQRELLKSIDIV